MRREWTSAVVLVSALALGLAACGDDTDGDVTTAPSSTVATSSTAAPSTTQTAVTSTTTTSTASTAPSTTTTVEVPVTTSLVLPGPTVPVDELAGDPIEIFPYAGAQLSVVGVRHDDVLNVRRLPGLDGEVLTTLAPTDAGFVATGRHQQLPSTFWMEVVVDGEVIGWINRTFAAIEGVTTDATARLLDAIEDPTAPSLEALGLLVAEAMVADPELLQRIEMSVAPTIGDLGEVTYDVIGIGDDASVGFRLHVFAVDEEGDGEWTLRTVEITDLCGRGGTPGGPCL